MALTLWSALHNNQPMNRSFTALCFVASLVFLLRALRTLFNEGPAAMAEGTNAAYAHGYQLGHATASWVLIAAAVACACIVWRRLHRAV
ncbi:MAG: hypothetical protein GAK31_01076 [Stenotrophomonas maltophilia]|uniref:Transmembrane protein n=1 Tax=Stenotrophomonas maltophilia TaxID=40324 RepID=A0A7V8FH25_STEMA|nr:MAG: hypothetical protein GAK31_01076 [Stenotrophomonas maltophilia]